jgi:uncharacterized membrane protein YeaQ/YmgE (transglycosylase-associated protein family)
MVLFLIIYIFVCLVLQLISQFVSEGEYEYFLLGLIGSLLFAILKNNQNIKGSVIVNSFIGSIVIFLINLIPVSFCVYYKILPLRQLFLEIFNRIGYEIPIYFLTILLSIKLLRRHYINS